MPPQQRLMSDVQVPAWDQNLQTQDHQSGPCKLNHYATGLAPKGDFKCICVCIYDCVYMLVCACVCMAHICHMNIMTKQRLNIYLVISKNATCITLKMKRHSVQLLKSKYIMKCFRKVKIKAQAKIYLGNTHEKKALVLMLISRHTECREQHQNKLKIDTL